MCKLHWTLLVLLISVWYSDGHKILTVFPLASKSHGILGDNMVKHLLNAGHEVTYITPFTFKNTHPNLKIVHVSENLEHFDESMLDLKLILDKKINFQDPVFLANMMSDQATNTMKNEKVLKLIRDPSQKFDVILAEYMFSDMYTTFAAVFNCPFIWFSTIEPHWMITSLVDSPVNPAYVPYYLHSRIHPFSFTDRIHELWTIISGLYLRNFQIFYKEDEVYTKLIAPAIKDKGREPPSYEALRYNASIVLGNTQVAVGDAFSLPPNYVHIGGYHFDEEPQALSQDLKKLLDGAKHGVIYFSLGSNAKSKFLPETLKRGLLNVFGELKQTVLWKFEENLTDLPKNVHIIQWAPQQSILAHKNVVLFITHGGLLSLSETIHIGVPIIAIPIFADQFLNALRAERKAIGKKVDMSYHLHEDLKVALKEVLADLPTYTKNVKELSAASRDLMNKPTDVLNFWVNHVVKTNGAPHMKSIALEVPLYKKLFLDLLAAVLVALVILLLTIRRMVVALTSKSPSKKQKRN